MNEHFCGESSMATGYKCHGTTLRSLGKLLRVIRSMKGVPSIISTAMFGTIQTKHEFVGSQFGSEEELSFQATVFHSGGTELWHVRT